MEIPAQSAGGCILEGYEPEQDFARKNGNTSRKTISRYRKLGLPYVMWNGQVYIHVAGARDWLMSRTKRHAAARTRHQK